MLWWSDMMGGDICDGTEGWMGVMKRREDREGWPRQWQPQEERPRGRSDPEYSLLRHRSLKLEKTLRKAANVLKKMGSTSVWNRLKGLDLYWSTTSFQAHKRIVTTLPYQ